MTDCKRSDYGWLKPNGYYEFRNKVGGEARVHRWIYSQHHGITLTPDQIIRHLCNNKWCIEITHLALGTKKENEQDKRNFGTARGSKNPAAVLTEKDIIEIRKLAGTMTQAKLGKKFGVSGATVNNILAGRIWKHV